MVRDIKKMLRQQMTALRDRQDANRRFEASVRACRHAITAWEQFRSQSGQDRMILFSYLSFRSEAQTQTLIEHCWEQGDIVLAPRITEQQGMLELHRIRSGHDVTPGRWNIPEPSVEAPIWPSSDYPEIDWILVPGLAFDHCGGRIGYGGGYYDRFAEKLRNMPTATLVKQPVFAALILPGQLMEHEMLPMEPFDLRVDLLFTEEGMIRTEKRV
ncbi:5-formyltetrahydrofolate cyclo-ligase [Paenibacillus sp. JX-17]|uniref:5-formyltetrahydrofolate cyclo-ligase n=1 Tax=Paenibacillus lacisoli TaxID=3064525 RepID=A0ABT9CD85_9BACL|nr:5-formyltetrahydrofolate cyclo-ligase [Paenibacillus sp. JX-17]MDO7907235.1 5-formyltetrahydrofolate cyclo-ligase [Paenibacillus sp. JX-17]